jgi:hypothetical protein
LSVAISFEARADAAPVELNDFFEEAGRAYKGHAIEAMQELAGRFQELAGNREFIRDGLLAELRRIAQEQNLVSFAPQSFIIGRSGPFSVRLNLWLPPVGSARKIEQEAKVYSYGRAHDHNFSLLTAGVAGPGYRTRIYEYDFKSVEGYGGEHVEMTFLEETMLPVGKAMIYRPHRDIHVQMSPERPSMSLNLLIEEKEIVEMPQYYFDLESSALVPMDDNEVGRRVSFLDVVGHFADGRCVDSLFDIARKNRNATIRAAAVRAIRTSSPEHDSEIKQLSRIDCHPLVLRETQSISA